MAASVTRTVNPLPFGDLEPHRFEDLVRQIAYDLRRWKSLEAIGRSGSDEGVDIRAIEQVLAESELEDEDSADEPPTVVAERLWIFQCKLEKALSPQKVRIAVKESLRALAKPPFGFVLAAACDLSAKARDAFREEMVAAGIQEFAVWARGELEDMLFQPKNDRLLFAYFGLSLQPRRRSLATSVRSIITRKKQLKVLLGEESGRGKLVLFRDPTDARYPFEDKKSKEPRRWVLGYALTLKKPDHLVVLVKEFLAAISPDGKQWDYIRNVNFVEDRADGELRAHQSWREEIDGSKCDVARAFLNEYIPEEEQAKLVVRRAVPLERLLAIDPIGDGHYPVPHIIIEFDKKNGPFTDEYFDRLESMNQHRHLDIEPLEENRAKIFPDPLPRLKDGPPASFDQTGKAAKLTAGGAAKFDGLLADLNAASAKGLAALPQHSTAENPDKRRFAHWRDKIAGPTLSAVVLRLRTEGHQARVVTRSSLGLDYIELRVGLARPYSHNPDYLLSGRLRFAFSSSVYLEIDPKDYDPRGGYNPPPVLPPLSDIDQAAVENQVLAFLERVKKNY